MPWFFLKASRSCRRIRFLATARFDFLRLITTARKGPFSFKRGLTFSDGIRRAKRCFPRNNNPWSKTQRICSSLRKRNFGWASPSVWWIKRLLNVYALFSGAARAFCVRLLCSSSWESRAFFFCAVFSADMSVSPDPPRYKIKNEPAWSTRWFLRVRAADYNKTCPNIQPFCSGIEIRCLL